MRCALRLRSALTCAHPASLLIALGSANACVHTEGKPPIRPVGAATPPQEKQRSALIPTTPTDLLVTSGSIEPLGTSRFAIRHESLRAQLRTTSCMRAELSFVYRGATARQTALASGELRRQIGIKLRGRDPCNVIYVMWHLSPIPALQVSVKYNPGQSEHAQCGDRGYHFVQPVWSASTDLVVRERERYTLSVQIEDACLRVWVNHLVSWVGGLPWQAVAIDGPTGIRSDNGEFDVEEFACEPGVAAH